MKFFLPKQEGFFKLLKELNGHLKEMAELFSEFAKDFKDFREYSQKAKFIENKADSKAHEIIEKLNKTFITPIDREDIYLLVHELDDIVDLIENVIHNIDLYGIREKKEAIDDFAHLILQASDRMDQLIDYLPKQKHSSGLNKLVVDIHGLEDKGDVVFQKEIQRLFREEKDPINVIKWKEILESLERITDKYQAVSNTIEGIIVKAS